MGKLLLKARDETSRWLMRTLQAGRVLRMPLLGVTAVSTLVTALKGTSLEQYTIPIIGTSGFMAFLFIWAYDKFQVLNLQQKHDADRSSNYVGPSMAISSIIRAKQFSVLSEGLEKGWDQEKIDKKMVEVTEDEIEKYRNGIDMKNFEGKE